MTLYHEVADISLAVDALVGLAAIFLLAVYLFSRGLENDLELFKATKYVLRYALDDMGRAAAKRQEDSHNARNGGEAESK